MIRRKYDQIKANFKEQMEYVSRRVNDLINNKKPQTGFAHNYPRKQQYPARNRYRKNNIATMHQRWFSRYQTRPLNYNPPDLIRQKNFDTNRTFGPTYHGFHQRNNYSAPGFPKPNRRNFSVQSGCRNCPFSDLNI